MPQHKTISDTILQLSTAKLASRKLAKSSNIDRNKALDLISNELLESKKFILTANNYEVTITRREFTVLKLIAHGYTGKEIANKLNISLNTVETHILHVKEKLGCTKRSDLVQYFLKSPYYSIDLDSLL